MIGRKDDFTFHINERINPHGCFHNHSTRLFILQYFVKFLVLLKFSFFLLFKHILLSKFAPREKKTHREGSLRNNIKLKNQH